MPHAVIGKIKAYPRPMTVASVHGLARFLVDVHIAISYTAAPIIPGDLEGCYKEQVQWKLLFRTRLNRYKPCESLTLPCHLPVWMTIGLFGACGKKQGKQKHPVEFRSQLWKSAKTSILN